MKRSRVVPARVGDASSGFGDITEVLDIDQGAFTLPSEPASVLSSAEYAAQEVARERRLRLRVWVLLVLPADEIGVILQSSNPPTIAELVALARTRAEETAERCQSCGAALPRHGVMRQKMRKTRKTGKSIHGYKRGAR